MTDRRHATRRHGRRGVTLVVTAGVWFATSGAQATETALSSSTYESPARGLAPAPDDTIAVTGTIPYLGGVASGSAYVYLGVGHVAIENPIVVVEGFDFNNDLGADELYELLNQETLLETIRAMGYDAVVLNFTDATDYIQRNAFLLIELLANVDGLVDPGLTYPLVGASMGGLVGRYALAYMETNAIPHRVHTFLSFDAPHAGATIPLGIQYWLAFFESASADAAAFLAALDSPAARQMLVYHHEDPPGATGSPNPLRADFEADLAALGDYPTLTRNVAVSNGSGSGIGQGFAPGEQIIEWEANIIIAQVVGNVFAVSDGPSSLIFEGLLEFFGSGDSQDVSVGGTEPYDNAPGGNRASMLDLDAADAPIGDIVALHPSHAFIPTISAIDLDTEDLFYDVLGDPNALSLTPFDAMFVPAANEAHVLVTPENKTFILAELLPPVAVGEPDMSAPPIPRPMAAPSPFTASTRIGFDAAQGGSVRLSVYDVAGRLVRRLVDGVQASGRHRIGWDGRDDAGRHVAPGVYVIHLETPVARATSKVVRR